MGKVQSRKTGWRGLVWKVIAYLILPPVLAIVLSSVIFAVYQGFEAVEGFAG